MLALTNHNWTLVWMEKLKLTRKSKNTLVDWFYFRHLKGIHNSSVFLSFYYAYDNVCQKSFAYKHLSFYSMSGVNDAHLLVINQYINTFPGKKLLQKLSQAVKRRMFRLTALIQLFLKSWNESNQKVELNLCKLVTAAYAGILCQDYPRIILALFPELLDYVVDDWGRSGESSVRGWPNAGYGLKMGGIKPSGHHHFTILATLKTRAQISKCQEYQHGNILYFRCFNIQSKKIVQ